MTTRKGDLLGLIGKELRNELTNTWINYAVPIGAKVEVTQPRRTRRSTVEHGRPGREEGASTSRRPEQASKDEGSGGYHGIVLVPNVVERDAAVRRGRRCPARRPPRPG